MQVAIRRALEACGCLVLSTSAWRQKAPSGVDKGVPDLLVTADGIPKGSWFGLEVKRPGRVAFSCAEQAALAASGRIVVAQSAEESLRAVADWLDRLGGDARAARLRSAADSLDGGRP